MMYILKHYFKTENKTDKSDFFKCWVKLGPVQNLQERPHYSWCDALIVNAFKEKKELKLAVEK